MKGLFKPNFDYSPPRVSGNEPVIGAKKKTPPIAQAQDYDTSQEVSQIEEILAPPKENISKIKTTAEEKVRRHSSSSAAVSKMGADKKCVKHISVIKHQDKGESHSKSSIPVSKGTNLTRANSDYIPGRYAVMPRKQTEANTGRHVKMKVNINADRKEGKATLRDSGVYSRPVSDAVLDPGAIGW